MGVLAERSPAGRASNTPIDQAARTEILAHSTLGMGRIGRCRWDYCACLGAHKSNSYVIRESSMEQGNSHPVSLVVFLDSAHVRDVSLFFESIGGPYGERG